MKRVLHLLFLGMMAAGMSGCASNREVSLHKDFWNNTGSVVGVVLASMPDPEVTVSISSSSPFGRQKTLIMSSRYNQDFDAMPYILKDQRKLWHYLKTHNVKGVSGIRSGIREIFIQGLASRGFRALSIDEDVNLKRLPRYTSPASGYAGKDYRGICRAKGVDFLVILDVNKYGVYCGYVDDRNIYTHVRASLTGEMVDMKTNRLLWRSTYRVSRDRGDSLLRCDRQETYQQIPVELGGAVTDAAVHLADDFFSGASN